MAVECAVLKLPGALSLPNPKMETFSAACRRLNVFILGTRCWTLLCGKLRPSRNWINFKTFQLPWVGKKKKKKKQIGRLIYRVLTNTCASEATLRVFYNFGVCWLEKSPQILWCVAGLLGTVHKFSEHCVGYWKEAAHCGSQQMARSWYWRQVERRLMQFFSGINSGIYFALSVSIPAFW